MEHQNHQRSSRMISESKRKISLDKSHNFTSKSKLRENSRSVKRRKVLGQKSRLRASKKRLTTRRDIEGNNYNTSNSISESTFSAANKSKSRVRKSRTPLRQRLGYMPNSMSVSMNGSMNVCSSKQVSGVKRRRRLRKKSPITMITESKENYDDNGQNESFTRAPFESKYESLTNSKRTRRKKRKSKEEEEEEEQRRLEEERIRLEKEEAERIQKEQEELERRIKEEKDKADREEGLRRLVTLEQLKEDQDYCTRFQDIKEYGNKIMIQEGFAEELYQHNLKAWLFHSLVKATKKSKFRFKLVRNFTRILRLNIEKRIRVELRVGFKRISKKRSKPFFRTANRANRKKKNQATAAQKTDRLDTQRHKQSKRNIEPVSKRNIEGGVSKRSGGVSKRQIDNRKKSVEPRQDYHSTNQKHKIPINRRVYPKYPKKAKKRTLQKQGKGSNHNGRNGSDGTKPLKTPRYAHKSSRGISRNKRSKSTLDLKNRSPDSVEKTIFNNSKQEKMMKSSQIAQKQLRESKSTKFIDKNQESFFQKKESKDEKNYKNQNFKSVSKVRRSRRRDSKYLFEARDTDDGVSFNLFGNYKANNDALSSHKVPLGNPEDDQEEGHSSFRRGYSYTEAQGMEVIEKGRRNSKFGATSLTANQTENRVPKAKENPMRMRRSPDNDLESISVDLPKPICQESPPSRQLNESMDEMNPFRINTEGFEALENLDTAPLDGKNSKDASTNLSQTCESSQNGRGQKGENGVINCFKNCQQEQQREKSLKESSGRPTCSLRSSRGFKPEKSKCPQKPDQRLKSKRSMKRVNMRNSTKSLRGRDQRSSKARPGQPGPEYLKQQAEKTRSNNQSPSEKARSRERELKLMKFLEKKKLSLKKRVFNCFLDNFVSEYERQEALVSIIENKKTKKFLSAWKEVFEQRMIRGHSSNNTIREQNGDLGSEIESTEDFENEVEELIVEFRRFKTLPRVFFEWRQLCFNPLRERARRLKRAARRMKKLSAASLDSK